MTPHRLHRIAQTALLVAFFAALWAPLASQLLRLDVAPASENRRLAGPPALPAGERAVASFPARFEAYFNDHFGLRNRLLALYRRIALGWLGVSPSRQVLIGRDGWLFLGTPAVLDDHRGADPMTQADLRAWERTLEARRAWLAARGIRYLVAIVPDKHGIYPEYLGDKVRAAPGRTRLDQLLAHLRAHGAVDVLDLRPALRAAKAQARVYQRTDTHWNGWGAYVAYRAIVERLSVWFPALRPWPPGDFRVVRREARGGDLALLLGMRDEFRERRISLVPRKRRRAHPIVVGPDGAAAPAEGRLDAFARSGAPVPSAVLIGDSFAPALAPLLAEHFGRLLLVEHFDAPALFPSALLERERPAVVIQQFTQRALLRPPPSARVGPTEAQR